MVEFITEGTIEFDVICGKCSQPLDSSTRQTRGNTVYADPCENCIAKERREAYDEGFDVGKGEAAK